MTNCDHRFIRIRKHDRSGERPRWVVVGWRCILCDHYEELTTTS